MPDEVEDTLDKLKAGAKAVAKKVSNPGRDLGEEYDKQKGKERVDAFEQANDSRDKDLMSPEKIASHDPAAIKRDQNQRTTGEPV